MMDRRELLKAFLLRFGVTVAGGGIGSMFNRMVFADDATAAGPIVKTSAGRVRGAFANGVYSFKGVPYGASTASPMRFLPPKPPKPWRKVRDTLQFGPPAPQDRAWLANVPSAIATDVRKYLGGPPPGTMGEDCLVLNVWTPSLRDASKRPVMVWLHGGGYTVGSCNFPLYDGTNLAAKHDVVVVGVTHRLNVFGYLYLGKIGGEKYADSGNVGMLDIVLALEWVRDNIARFGGDPGNVTIFGDSGGGAKVTTLMAMPPARGLFHKAIVESGSALRAISPEDADAAARKFVAHLNVASDRVDDLHNIPMDQLIAALHSMTGPSAINLGPVVDGRSLPRHPFDPDAPAISATVPMLIGTTATESTILAPLITGDPGLFSLTEADMRAKLKAYLRLTDNSKLDSLIALYKRSRPDATPSDIFFAIATDRFSISRMAAITQAERKVAQGAAPAYMYIFAWETPVEDGRLMSPHAVELPFVFDNVDKSVGTIGTGADLQPLADKVSSAWVAFARIGNPSHPGIPEWPAYTLSDRATMIFNNDCKVVNDPGKDERLAMSALS